MRVREREETKKKEESEINEKDSEILGTIIEMMVSLFFGFGSLSLF